MQLLSKRRKNQTQYSNENHRIELEHRRALQILQSANSIQAPKRITITWIQKNDEMIAGWLRGAKRWVSGNKLISLDDVHTAMRKQIQEFEDILIKNARLFIYEINTRYNLQYSIEDIIQRKKTILLSVGIIRMSINEQWIQKAYDSAMDSRLPASPMHEYPNARSIKRHFIIHTGPTNSGKTFQALEALKKAKYGVYLSPLRLLALEVYEKLNMDGVPCSLSTGEERIDVPFSNHISSTVEKMSEFERYHVAVIDEAQMLSDDQRGHAWTRAIMGVYADEVHICCAPLALPIIEKLIRDCKDTYEIHKNERHTPLQIQEKAYQFPQDVQPGDALIAFSRKEVLEIAEILNEKQIKTSVIYGNLPPEARRKQVEQFIEKENQVIVSTDAIGMGLNLPIKRIVFMQTKKFDGKTNRLLNTQEAKQIAGRAGRRGMYEVGFIAATENIEHIKKMIDSEDTSIHTLYLAPQEQVILNIPFGTLREKLQAWQNNHIRCEGFKKMNLSERMYLLDMIEKMKLQITEQQQFRAIAIPFAQNDPQLIRLWTKYLEELNENVTNFSKPRMNTSFSKTAPLHVWEQYYRMIDLYYSASNTFEKTSDLDWIKMERSKCISKIHLTACYSIL